jgi:hypothetical protein
MNNAKLFNFWGVRRSGNHAIVNWAMSNFVDLNNKIDIAPSKFYRYYIDGLLFINDYDSTRAIDFEHLKKGLKLNPKIVIFTHEERLFSVTVKSRLKSKNFIIVRNLENVIASYYKKEWPEEHNRNIDRSLFDLWEYYLKSEYPKIHYDRWLIDKKYRDEIADLMGVENRDITNIVTKEGGGSSFIGLNLDSSDRLLNRFSQVDLPDSIIDLIVEYGSRNPEYCNLDLVKNEFR